MKISQFDKTSPYTKRIVDTFLSIKYIYFFLWSPATPPIQVRKSTPSSEEPHGSGEK